MQRAIGRFRRWRRARKVARIRPFFVCGHPKSGTNWVSNLVNLHPHIFCRGELHLQRIRQVMIEMRAMPIYQPRKRMRRALETHFARMVRECLVTFDRDRRDAFVLGDHSPEPLMHIASDPAIRYLHITRDGRDVLISYTYHWLRVPRAQAVSPVVYPLYLDARASLDGSRESLDQAARRLLADHHWVTEASAHWAQRVRVDRQALQADETAMREKTLSLKYEDLHADTEGQRRRMYEFLGVDPSLAAPLSAQTRTIPGFSANDPRSMHRKGAAGEWRGMLDSRQRGWFDAAAGNELIELGYERDRSWVAGPVVTRPASPAATGTAIAT